MVHPGRTLHEVAQELERQIYEQLYSDSGDFSRMAERLLLGSNAANSRRVRLRYNQLGLRIRDRSGHKS